MNKIKTFFIVLTGLLFFLFAMVLIGIEAIYHKGLTYIDGPFPAPATVQYSSRIHEIIWYGTGENGEVKIIPQMPWVVLGEYSNLYVRSMTCKEKFLRMGNGVGLCGVLGRNVLVSGGKRMKSLDWELASFSMEIWISRHWTTEEVLDTYADRLYYGRGAYGLNSAAKAYFAKSPDGLTDRQLVSLIVLLKDPQMWKRSAYWKKQIDKAEQILQECRK